MIAKLGALILVLLITGVGYWYFTEGSPSAEMGQYGYTCANGETFTMTPAEDLSWVAITPGDDASFGPQTLSYESNIDGMKYFGYQMALIGEGEEIELRIGSATTTCNPVPNAEMAPWNWGDRGEGAGAEQNPALIVSQSVIGVWKSNDDASFSRSFNADGTFTDSHTGSAVARGLWFAFSANNAPAVPFDLEDNAAYIQLASSDGSVLYFQVIELTPATLSMIYMDRGGVLNFTRAE